MSSTNINQQYYLSQIGITTWQERAQGNTKSQQQAEQANTWKDLIKQVTTCQRCALSQTRKNAVFGVGNQQADLVIVGEAPGAEEDRRGEPFVGRAGQLLNEMLLAIGLARETVFIANVLKCRPPNNRDPSKQEVATCTPYLEQQLTMLQPKAILAVGRVAAHHLLGIEDAMASMRGKQLLFAPTQTPLFVTYHPAYLLRKPSDKRKAYLDLLKIKSFLVSEDLHSL